MPAEITVEIVNKRGLHARAAAKFVKIVAQRTARVTVVKVGFGAQPDSPPVGGASILGLMMLGADLGSKLFISAEGEDAEKTLSSLKHLVENKFGEGE